MTASLLYFTIRRLVRAVQLTSQERDEAEAFRRANERFCALVQNSSDIISLFDAVDTILYHSPAIERILGYRPQDRIGRNIFRDNIVHPDDLDSKRAFFDAIRNQPGVPVAAEFRLRHADGSWRSIEAIGQNFLDDPSVAGIVTNYRDVTERRQAEEALRASERRFRIFVDHATDGAFFLARPGAPCPGREPTSVRKPGVHAGGTDRDVLRSTSIWTSVPPWSKTVHRKHEAGELVTFRTRHRRKDGTVFPVEVRDQAFREGGRSFAVCLARDITDQKRAEEAMSERARLASLAADVGVALTGADTLPGSLQPCAEALVRHLSATFARVWTLNEAENVLELQASAGIYTGTDGTLSRVPVVGRPSSA